VHLAGIAVEKPQGEGTEEDATTQDTDPEHRIQTPEHRIHSVLDRFAALGPMRDKSCDGDRSR